jgi:hypothetical protein
LSDNTQQISNERKKNVTDTKETKQKELSYPNPHSQKIMDRINASEYVALTQAEINRIKSFYKKHAIDNTNNNIYELVHTYQVPKIERISEEIAKAGNWSDNPQSAAEATALSLYFNGGTFHHMNALLWQTPEMLKSKIEQSGDSEKTYVSQFSAIDLAASNALKKLPNLNTNEINKRFSGYRLQDNTLIRHMQISEELLSGFLGQHREGDNITYNSFTSSTVFADDDATPNLERFSRYANVKMIIKRLGDKESSGRLVDHFKNRAVEGEVLFPPGTTFKVEKVEYADKDGSGKKHYITVSEVISDTSGENLSKGEVSATANNNRGTKETKTISSQFDKKTNTGEVSHNINDDSRIIKYNEDKRYNEIGLRVNRDRLVSAFSEKLISKVEQCIQRAIDKSSIYICTPLASLETILNNGYKNAHSIVETDADITIRGGSEQNSYLNARKKAERQLYNLSETSKPEDHPTYGIYSENYDQNGLIDLSKYYGGEAPVRLKLKEGVKKRSTVMVGTWSSVWSHDKIENNPYASDSNKFSAGSIYANLDQKYLTEDALKSLSKAKSMDSVYKGIRDLNASLLEAQIHGSVLPSTAWRK